jgi:HAE1 family hydrophobic/amphiphilic exporter-1
MIGFAVRRPAVVWAVSVALLVAGAIAFGRLPLATRTTVELPRLQVFAAWPGAAPEVIESWLTAPLEAAVQGVRGVRRVDSFSRDDLASLTIELEPAADVQLARLAILERLERLRPELPPGASAPVVGNYVPEGLEEAPLLQLSVSGPVTPGALQRLLEERVQPRLTAVPGVAGVQVRGGAELGVAVSYDPPLLRRVGVSPARLAEAIAGARVVQALGTLRADGVTRPVTLRDQPAAIDALLDLPVRGPAGRTFRLGELATVRADEDARGRFFRLDGVPALVVEVTRHPGADAIRTAAALRAAVAELGPTLPPLVRVRVANDQSEALAEELRDLLRRGGIAFGAVLLVLALLLRDARAVAVAMGSTAVAIAGTALSLHLLGIPANLLTLAGLGMGVGILVQNALVVVERIGAAPAGAERRAQVARRLVPAITGSTLTTAVVLLPFLYLQGDARAAFAPFAAAFAFALAWSVFTAHFVAPALAREGRAAAARGTAWRRTRRAYERVIAGALRRRWLTLATTGAAFGLLGWGFATKVPRTAWGGGVGERRTTLSVSLSFPRGSDPASVDRAIREFEQVVLGRPEVEQVRAQATSATSGQLGVLFTRAGGVTAVPLELQELLTQRAVLIGGASVYVQGNGPGFASGLGGVSFSSFRINVLGYSYEGVSRLAADLRDRLARITRVRDVRITAGGWFGGERGWQVTLEPDRGALARFGVTAQQFSGTVAREVRGPAGRQFLEIGGEELPVTVKAAGARDRSLDELREAFLPSSATGTPVRIGDVARVDEREALSAVVRQDQQYVRLVSYDFRGPTPLARRTHQALVASLDAPPGYRFEDLSATGGVPDDQSARGLWLVFALGVALVVLAVALVFDSVWGAAMVFLSLPLALAGVAGAFWAFGAPFTREAAVGVILVVGLSVNQAILLVDAALERRRRREASGRPAGLAPGDVLRAVHDRAGTIVLVTLAALASLVPLSVGTDATRLFGAIALATAGGTLAGTVGALMVLPALLVGTRGGADCTEAGGWRGSGTANRG